MNSTEWNPLPVFQQLGPYEVGGTLVHASCVPGPSWDVMACRAEDIQDLVDYPQSVPAPSEQFRDTNTKHLHAP
jgi:hypothetical protein